MVFKKVEFFFSLLFLIGKNRHGIGKNVAICWQTTLTKYHTLFFRKLGKMSQNLLSPAVVIGALRVNTKSKFYDFHYSYHDYETEVSRSS